MVKYVQFSSVAADGRRWYAVAALTNLGMPAWLAEALKVEGTRAVRVVEHDELLAMDGEMAIEMAHTDLTSLDPNLLT